MNLIAIDDFQADDETSVQEFFDQNFMLHETINRALLDTGVILSHLPLFTDTSSRENLNDLLFVHDGEHRAIANALGIASPPDLSEIDMDDQDRVESWLQDHSNHHGLIALALGL